MADRTSGHRSKFYEILRKNGEIGEVENKDEYVPGLHLFNDHNLRQQDDFDKSYELTILEKCTPASIDVKEHFWIQKMRTLAPFGLNSVDPYGIPLLS